MSFADSVKASLCDTRVEIERIDPLRSRLANWSLITNNLIFTVRWLELLLSECERILMLANAAEKRSPAFAISPMLLFIAFILTSDFYRVSTFVFELFELPRTLRISGHEIQKFWFFKHILWPLVCKKKKNVRYQIIVK